MSCVTPVLMVKTGEGVRPTSGRTPVFGELTVEREGKLFEVPCNKCIGCKLDTARMWAVRIEHEAQLYDSSLFVTMTYDDKALEAKDPPERLHPSLKYRDVQLFMKRLRKEYRGVAPGPKGNYPLRFFVAGEYGGLTGRPHWHMVLFNMVFKDQVAWMNGMYHSEDLERLWSNGDCRIGFLTPERASYVAGYVNKKTDPRSGRYESMDWYTGEVVQLRPEFHEQSNRPGIGFWWYEKFGSDVFPMDHVVKYGKRYKPPTYYWRKFRESGEEAQVEEVADARMARARDQARLGESTPERRAVREEVAESRVRLFSRREL